MNLQKTLFLNKAPCSPNPCQNNFGCSNFDNNTVPYYLCNCANGYTGYDCEICNKLK
jgi:hypothetical protein